MCHTGRMEIKDGFAYLSEPESQATGYLSPFPVDRMDAMDLLGTFQDRERRVLQLQSDAPELLHDQRAQIPRLCHELERDRPFVDEVASRVIRYSADKGLGDLR